MGIIFVDREGEIKMSHNNHSLLMTEHLVAADMRDRDREAESLLRLHEASSLRLPWVVRATGKFMALLGRFLVTCGKWLGRIAKRVITQPYDRQLPQGT
jgi:hypothetical protein